MSQKILHVCGLDKFIPPFIDFIEKNFDFNNHYFWLSGSHVRFSVKQESSVYKVKKGKHWQALGLLKLVKLMHRSEKIILHGLFNMKVVLLLFLMPWLLKKCYWVIWGGDLYVYQLGIRKWKWKFKEVFRRPVIKNMGHLITYIPGDVELARKWYGARGEYHECLMYLSNVVDPKIIHMKDDEVKTHAGLNILVGNSADPSNNHIETLQKLMPYKDEEIKIYVPLSYGDQQHAQRVIKQGKEWFGEKFIPVTSFISFDEYIFFLKNIDIAIFNHERQQAMGNTIALLSMGKKVIMQEHVSQFVMLKGLGFEVKALGKLADLNMLESVSSKKNIDIACSAFSFDRLVKQYSIIFRC